MKKITSIILTLLLGGIYYIYDTNLINEIDNPNLSSNQEIKDIALDELQVHYIDVGQGDSIFIELPNNETILIDAGVEKEGITVQEYINNLGYTNITYLIATHPHADHIGGMEHIVTNFDITNIYMPKVAYTTNTYENLLLSIQEKNYKINSGLAGTTILNEDNLSLEIIYPPEVGSDMNNNSLVLKLTYLNNSFLFLGDTEEEENINENVDVVKVGHHGSDTSSDYDFIKNISAEYAIISVGDNNYGHPHTSVIDDFESVGTEVYRTDICNDIIVISDGNNLELEC